MYSILSKENKDKTVSKLQIIHFLADAESDKDEIKDICAPGSTIEVLGDSPATDKKTYIKTPSGEWKEYISAQN